MTPCISQLVTLPTTFEQDATVYSQAGWRALEIWLTKLETYLERHSLQEARSLLDGEGLAPVAASFQGGLLLSSGRDRETHWEHYRRRLEILQALEVPRLVLAPDFAVEPGPEDLARAAESLAEAAHLATKHGVLLALEFQKQASFCASLDSALALLMHSGAPASICFDVFHYYTGPSMFEDLALLGPKSLGVVQLCDLAGTPRELARDSDRIFPGEGDFQLGPLLEQFARIGYQGPVCLEVASPLMWSMPADRVVGIALAALERTLGELAASDHDVASRGDGPCPS